MEDNLCNDLLEVARGYPIKNVDGVRLRLLSQGNAGITIDLYKQLAEVAKRHGYIITSVITESGGVEVTFKEGELPDCNFDYEAIANDLSS